MGEAVSRLSSLGGVSDKHSVAGLAIRTLPPKQRCLSMPPGMTRRLYDRHDIFRQLDNLLVPCAADLSLQSVALHGVGGVGKTSIASSYAEKKYYEEVYDVVAWIHGEKDSSLRQSFTNIAMRLKLPGAQSQADEENQILVHHWLQSTGTSSAIPFLVIVETPATDS